MSRSIVTPLLLTASQLTPRPRQRIVVLGHDPLFEGNDRVFRNRYRLRTYLPTTSSDVAITDIMLVPQIADPVFGVERMHFECSGINEQTWTDKFVMLVVFSQDVNDPLSLVKQREVRKLLRSRRKPLAVRFRRCIGSG